MIQEFDYFGQPEIPYIILTNPNKEEIFSLGLAYETKITKRFNAVSEFSFVYPKSIDGNETNLEAYDYIKNKRLVLVEGYGYFQIVDSVENLEGSTPIKSVSCQSLETELIAKRVTAYGGTKKLWDALDSDNTVLQDMINIAPNWSVGHVDSELLTLYRTFEVSDTNVYNFLTNEVSKAFECIFVFDTDAREIKVYTSENAVSETDIFLSFDNVISKAEFSEKSDEMVTALSVYGGGTLNIRNVNPLGTDKIYDFSYYKNSSWMSQELIDALDNWETIVSSQQSSYADNLTLLQTYNQELLVLQSELASLNSEYLTIEGIKVVRIQAGQSYEDINEDLVDKQAEIDNQETLITNKETQITTVTDELEAINSMVSFDNNFTPSQLLELDNYIFENTYKNENIIQTDTMTLVQIQEAAQSLYNQAQRVLSKISQPRYEFSIESINYTVLEEFSIFTSQTVLGSVVTAEIKEGEIIETVLLELSVELDNPESFEMVFSNRLRLDNGAFSYSDLQGQVVKTGSAVAFDSLKWSNWDNEYKDTVSTFITSSLNAAVNNLVSNENQDITINQNGLRARQWNGTAYEDKQMWMVNNMLAFSDDGFQTAKLALGEITLEGGGTAYGLVADVIVGRILAGNELTITNEGANFTLNATGATLSNAKFTTQTTNTRITIDPTRTNVFTIQKNEGGTFNNKFWVDNTGNVNFSGNLTGATGTFSGTLSASVGNIGTLVIDSNGLKTANGLNYLRGNGDLKWGGLSITGGSATFTGDIYANKLIGQIVNTQVADGAITDGKVSTGLNAGKITTGFMSGSRLYGGTPTFNGVTPVGSDLAVYGNLQVVGGSILSQGGITTNTGYFYTNLGYINAGNYGISTSRSINTPLGTRTITFSGGICVGFS